MINRKPHFSKEKRGRIKILDNLAAGVTKGGQVIIESGFLRLSNFCHENPLRALIHF
jgi:hypothetical protein